MNKELQEMIQRLRNSDMECNRTLLDNLCDQAADEVERLTTLLSTPPTWLCHDCRDQWIIRDEAEKQGTPKITDNRDAPALPPQEDPDGNLKCPGPHCGGIINVRMPARCPDCLQPLEKTK